MTRDEFLRDWNDRFQRSGLSEVRLEPHNDRGRPDEHSIALYDGARMRMVFLTGVTRLADAYLQGFLEGRLEREKHEGH